jgi:predicted MFS family arabinose efflux permease
VRRPLFALIAAEVISSLGSLMTLVALPWFVLQTTGSPEKMGVVLAAEAAPMALLAIPSGRLAGRLGARRTLLLCDAFWVPVVAAIPLLHFAGALSFALLVALSFLAGLPWAARYGSQGALVPELVGEDATRVAEANALFQTLSRLTYFAGPAIGGFLLAGIGAPAVLLIDAASFAVSFLIVAALVTPSRPTPAPAGPAPGTAAGGLRFLLRDAVLGPITVAQILSQGAFMAMIAAVPVLAFAAYDRNAELAGILVAAWGAGAMVGSAVAFRLVRSHPPLRLGALAWTLQSMPLWLMVLAPSPAIAITALALSGLGNGIRVPPIVGATTSRVPQPLRAETLTVSSALVLSGGLLGLVLVGPALDSMGTGAVFGAIAAAQTLAAGLALKVAYGPPSAVRPRQTQSNTFLGATPVHAASSLNSCSRS